MGILVVIAYKPKSGKQAELEQLVLKHIESLKQLNMVTKRRPVIGRASDNTIVEIFEWRSKQAIDEAHDHPQIQQLWSAFSSICDYVPIGEVAGMNHLFSELSPLN